MLKSIRLQNFFGFQDCTINLEKGANVLVGINGSGKSNFFKAVKLLSSLPTSDSITNLLYIEYGGLESIVFKQKREKYANLNINITALIGDPNDKVHIDFHSYLYSCNIESSHRNGFYLIEDVIGFDKANKQIQLVKFEKGYNIRNYNGTVDSTDVEDRSKSFLTDNNLKSKPIFWYYLKTALLDVTVYGNFDTSLSSPLRKPNPPRLDKYLLTDGNNLASLLNDIKLTDKETYNRIVNAIKNVNDKFLGVEFKQLSGFIEMWLEEESLNSAISPINISDGTLKFLCLMAILYNPNRGSVICIDEPEVGLHPDMINTLHEAIEFAAETSQIIISTHSAHLLNYFEIEQVRVFEKDENNTTIVNQFSKEEFAGWQQKFQLGKAWREGDIGGKRW
jgi:predicted ATPase